MKKAEIEFKYRKNTWRLFKEPYCISLQKQYELEDGTKAWKVEGYYSDIGLLFKKMVRDHLIKDQDAKDMLLSIKQTCQELKDAVLGVLK